MEDESAPDTPGGHQNAGRSIIIRHSVRPNMREWYETWLRRIIAAAAEFPGHQGVHIVRPPPGHNTFEAVVRFSGAKEAEAWLESDIRKELVSEIATALETNEHIEIHSGIDFWFTPPESKAKQPTRWKQWLITTAVIWPLTMIVPAIYQPLFEQVPLLAMWGVRHGIVAATIVVLVVYLIMPRVVRAVSGWLFR